MLLKIQIVRMREIKKIIPVVILLKYQKCKFFVASELRKERLPGKGQNTGREFFFPSGRKQQQRCQRHFTSKKAENIFVFVFNRTFYFVVLCRHQLSGLFETLTRKNVSISVEAVWIKDPGKTLALLRMKTQYQ